MLHEDLMDIGLSDKEAKVYLATLELGQAAIQQIANKAKVNRATTYVIAEQLIKMGLMSSFDKDKKQHFAAAAPDRLLELVNMEIAKEETKRKRIEKLMPQLQSINNRVENKPVVRYYEGKEGIKTLVEEFMRSASGIIRMAYSVDAIKNAFTSEEKQIFRNNRIKTGAKTKVVYTYKNGILENTMDGKRRKVPFAKFPISVDIEVHDKLLMISNISKNFGGFIIEDKEVAKSMMAILDLAWEAADKYNK